MQSAHLQFMLSGQGAKAAQAKALGIVDHVVDSDLVEAAITHAKAVAGKDSHPRIRDLNEKVKADRANIDDVEKAAAKLVRSRAGQFAPEQIVKCVRKAVETDDFDEGMAFERDRFGECLVHPQREAMIRIFFSERQAARVDGLPKGTETVPVKRAVVIGAGTMGGGISMCFANAGIPVTIIDRSDEDLERGYGVINGNYESQVSRGRISQEQYDKRRSLMSRSTDYDCIKDADVVIEAVYENLELKQEIFKKIDEVAPAHAILASNTSALNIDAIASVTSRPDKVIGMHFFSPANIMRLLEVVRGEKSADSTIATAMGLGRPLGKISVLAGNCPGFIGNRMIAQYTREASLLLLEGALPHQVDRVMREFGMPMGPFQMADLVGLDLGWRARKMAGGSNEITARIADAMCEDGRFGQKNGKGYYLYEKGNRTPIHDPYTDDLVVKTSEDLGYKRRDFTDEQILNRCLLPLVNEGAKILEEGYAQRASDIDVVYVYGYGFPIWRGGPMHWASSLGLDKVVEELEGMDKAPADLLKSMAANGEKF